MISALRVAALTLLFASVAESQGRGRGNGKGRSGPPQIEYSSVVTFTIGLGFPPRPVGTIEIGLFDNYVPYTAANFAQLALAGVKDNTGSVRKYEGSRIHRIVPGFVIQGGDITTGDGRGGYSIYGRKFADENFSIQHYGAGWVSMANAGKDTNNSQFFITLAPTPSLNGKHTVFGKVIKGMNIVNAISKMPTLSSEKPRTPVTILKATWRKLEKPIFTPLAGVTNN